MKIYVVTYPSEDRPAIFRSLDDAKRHAEQERSVDPVENPAWCDNEQEGQSRLYVDARFTQIATIWHAEV